MAYIGKIMKMCTNEELQQEIKTVDSKLEESIKTRKAGMSAIEIKVETISRDLCSVKDDIAEVKKVLDKKVLTALSDHKEMVLKNNEELSKLRVIADLAPSIQEMVENQKVVQKGTKWFMGFLGFVALVIGIILAIMRIFTGRF